MPVRDVPLPFQPRGQTAPRWPRYRWRIAANSNSPLAGVHGALRPILVHGFFGGGGARGVSAARQQDSGESESDEGD